MMRRFLLFVVAMLAFASPAWAQRRVALVIGNAAYKETAPLTNTRHDATDMAATLKRLGFEVLDGLDLDKRAMERLIRQFEQKLEGADLALFFYAGHGIQISGQNHLVPVDARLAAEGDVDFESLPLSLVLSRMERTVKTSLVLLDACRDNPLARNLARTMGTRAANVGQGLAEVKTGIGTMISFSTQLGNVALDGTGRNSPYTTALLKEIDTPGRDLLTTLAAVRGAVVQATGGKQVPWEHTSLLGPVVLNGAPVVNSAAIAPPPAAQQQPTISAAAEAWPLVKDTTSVAALEAFIGRFGGTFYADLARARIAEINAGKRPPPPAPSKPDLACGNVLDFLKDTGAFGSKPIREIAYAERVTYYKKGVVARSEVVSAARSYELKFPSRSYEIDDKTMIIRALPDNLCQLKFEYNYIAKSSTQERSGRGSSDYLVRRLPDRFEIVSETGDVTTRTVKELR